MLRTLRPHDVQSQGAITAAAKLDVPLYLDAEEACGDIRQPGVLLDAR